HIADDWRYGLWHKQSRILDSLRQGIPDATIFACSVGEIDYSFDFSYYTAGELCRKFVVEDLQIDKRRRTVVENLGDPLPSEKPLSEIGEEQEYVLSLASGCGVKIDHRAQSIRCYAQAH